MKKLILLLALVFISCNSNNSEIESLSEVLELNHNEDLLGTIKNQNDSISFGLTYGYNIGGKIKEINIKIYNNQDFNSTESERMLERESKWIKTRLKQEIKNLSSYDKLNFFLISKKSSIDSLELNIN